MPWTRPFQSEAERGRPDLDIGGVEGTGVGVGDVDVAEVEVGDVENEARVALGNRDVVEAWVD